MKLTGKGLRLEECEHVIEAPIIITPCPDRPSSMQVPNKLRVRSKTLTPMYRIPVLMSRKHTSRGDFTSSKTSEPTMEHKMEHEALGRGVAEDKFNKRQKRSPMKWEKRTDLKYNYNIPYFMVIFLSLSDVCE